MDNIIGYFISTNKIQLSFIKALTDINDTDGLM